MVKFARRQAAFFKWLIIIILATLAMLTVSLRIFLPHLSQIKTPIQIWANKATGFNIDFAYVSGHWSFFEPSLSLHTLSLSPPDPQKSILTADTIDLHFDLWNSLLNMKPTFSNIAINGLRLDLTQFPETGNTQSISLKKQLERLFLVNLGHFSVQDSTLIVNSPSNEREIIDIDSLLWDYDSGKHRLEGVFSVQGTSLNQVEVKGEFVEKSGLSTLDGEFYLNVENVSLKNWITKFLNPKIAIEKANVNGEMWLSVKEGLPTSLQLNLKDSELRWLGVPSLNNENPVSQELSFSQGSVFLTKEAQSSWRIETDNFAIKTDKSLWSAPRLNMQFSKDKWLLNIDQLDLFLLKPLMDVFAFSTDIEQTIRSFSLKGKIQDIRLAGAKGAPLRYSANIEDLSFDPWGYLPGVNKLTLFLMGEGKQGKVELLMEDDRLSYGSFFQAPLQIDKAKVSAYWAVNDNGILIWSDRVDVRSAELRFLGEFRLDLPNKGSPWLSFYAEASLNDAGETWRYLPTRALGENLTNYLTSAIRGGRVKNAKLLWNGDFATFPYLDNNGIFQAYVPIKKGEFSFNTHWPMLTNLDLDLLFQNDALYLNATNVDLMGARGFDLKGEIASFKQHASLNIRSSIETSGDDLRDYMLATPLVGSVGAALTDLNIGGLIEASITLDIPLNGDKAQVKGVATLENNTLSVVRPGVKLDDVSGIIEFENDIIWAKGVKASLLEQPVEFEFKGETESDDYLVNVKMKGDWTAKKLKSALNLPALPMIEGRSQWALSLGVALKDIGFTYSADLKTDLTNLALDFPAPLYKPSSIKSEGRFKASGDARHVFVQAQLPNLEYQADIAIREDMLDITQSRTLVGEGELSLEPLLGNAITINTPQLDVMAWKRLWDTYRQESGNQYKTLAFKVRPPSRVSVKVNKVLAGEMIFNNFSMSARNKSGVFRIIANSKELAGYAWWERGKNLSVNIEHLFLNMKTGKNKEKTKAEKRTEKGDTPALRKLMAMIPSTDLNIDELWLQGYRLGKLNATLVKSKNQLALSSLSLGSGETKLLATGKWNIDKKGTSHSKLDFTIEGPNSSDLMGRFAVSEGIHDAPFMTKATLVYDGAPWALKIDTLNGSVETRLGKGYVSGVGGAGKLLGLFSIESILRKIQLDFSGVFEDGLAFDEISGSATINDGVIVSDNIVMKALAGDMFVKGIANLVDNEVNAQVRFIPDLTSGIPVFTAFAVTPQTALYVLALTKVISPVVEAFTQVRYQVTGSIDAPVIKEISRSTGEVKVPRKAKKRLRAEQQGS